MQAGVVVRTDDVGGRAHDEDRLVADQVLAEVADLGDLLLAAGHLPDACPEAVEFQCRELRRSCSGRGGRRRRRRTRTLSRSMSLMVVRGVAPVQACSLIPLSIGCCVVSHSADRDRGIAASGPASCSLAIAPSIVVRPRRQAGMHLGRVRLRPDRMRDLYTRGSDEGRRRRGNEHDTARDRRGSADPDRQAQRGAVGGARLPSCSAPRRSS